MNRTQERSPHKRRPPQAGSGAAWGRQRLAVSAEPEQLDAVGVDPEPGQPLDLGDGVVEARIGDLGRPAAARADDVMVMGAGAGDVGMIATRQIEPLDDAELDEQIQGAEQGRPAHPDVPVAGDRGELRCREVPVVGRDQVGERQARAP